MWMMHTLKHVGVVTMVKKYLLSLDKLWMQDCIEQEEQSLCNLVVICDWLQCNSFVDGRIAPVWLVFVAPLLRMTD